MVRSGPGLGIFEKLWWGCFAGNFSRAYLEKAASKLKMQVSVSYPSTLGSADLKS